MRYEDRIKNYDNIDNLLDIALKNYIVFTEKDRDREDSVRKDIFELNEELKNIEFLTQENINTVIDKLIDVNETKQLLVDDISLCNMKKFIELKPQKALEKWNKLLDCDIDLKSRINSFKDMTIEDEREFTKTYGNDFYVELDSISYILSSFYFKVYFIYRDAYFREFLKIFDIELYKKNCGEIYDEYLSLLNQIATRVYKINSTQEIDLFFAEDFLLTFSTDEQLKKDSIDQYLNELSLEFKRLNNYTNSYKDLVLEPSGDYGKNLKYDLDDKTNLIQTIDFTHPLDFTCLYFEDEDILKTQISSALSLGKSIILTGPPGTGKSKLAKKVAESLGASFKMVTALSSWSNYDTIGGYKPSDDGSLYFEEGIILSCLKDRFGNNINKWLIIDEMNRADIDKAFGPFFSTLSGDDVVLGFRDRVGRDIELLLEENLSKEEKTIEERESNKYIIPKDFRIIGTINTLDKTSLYNMSYAFMRRFAFIPVSIPKDIDCRVLRKFTDIWKIDISDLNCTRLSLLWNTINKYRKIGPAIIEDIAKFINSKGDYTSGIIIYIFPQLEGLFDDKIKSFTDSIKKLEFIEDKQRLENSIEDFFNLKLNGE